MFFHEMKMLERVFWLKRIKGGGNPMHEATSTSGSFVTDVVAPLKKLLLTLSPIQSGSGTPSPDNVRPISGHTEVNTHRTGKNLFDVSEVTEASVPALGEIRGSTLITKRAGSYSGVWWLGWKQKLTENDVVSISADVLVPTQEGLTSKQVGFGIVKSDETNIGAYNTRNVSSFGTSERLGATVTVPKTGEYYIRLQGFGNVLNEIVEYSNIQLELGSTATAYEPYQGTSYTTPLGRTVYGGTLDVVSGELVVDGVKDSLRVENNHIVSEFFQDTAGNWFEPLTNVVRISLNRISQSSNMKTASNQYQPAMANYVPHLFNYASDTPHWYINNQLYLYLPKDIVGESAETIRAYIADNPFEVYIPFAEPITYQLDPQQVNSLIGQNNIITEDGAEVSEIVYMTRLVGSPQTEEEEANEEPVEESEEPEGE